MSVPETQYFTCCIRSFVHPPLPWSLSTEVSSHKQGVVIEDPKDRRGGLSLPRFQIRPDRVGVVV
jgi:hypothetical protein